MWLIGSLLLGGIGWYLFRRFRKSVPIDDRLTLAYWRNSTFVVGAYLLWILLGAGVTRLQVGFQGSGAANFLMLLFFVLWVAYGGIWLARLLPTTKPRPAWLTKPGYWLDAGAVLALLGLAIWARTM